MDVVLLHHLLLSDVATPSRSMTRVCLSLNRSVLLRHLKDRPTVFTDNLIALSAVVMKLLPVRVLVLTVVVDTTLLTVLIRYRVV